MKMTIYDILNMANKGDTPELYEKRVKRIRRLANERDILEDKISVLDGDPGYIERCSKAKVRLEKVLKEIEKLM